MDITVQRVHFTVNAESVVALCRQAWLYEGRQEWAIKTLGYLAYGIGVDQIDSILNGVSTLKSTEDKTGCFLAREEDESWLLEIQKHTTYLDSKYYTFAGRKIEREPVDTYTNSVVGRLRDAMRNPAILAMANPIELVRLEQKRREMHHEIFKAAGFTKKDIMNWDDGQGSDEFCAFAIELSKHVDKETDWFQESKF